MKQMTKIKAIVLALLLCVGAVLAVLLLVMDFSPKQVYADDVSTHSTEDDLLFSLYNNNTEYKVSARNRSLTEAIIPDIHNGLPVTEVANNAFTGCANLKKVEIPRTVRRIGNNAFFNCKNLEDLQMWRVEEYGNRAFANCVKLPTMALGGFDNMGGSVFSGTVNDIYIRKTESEMNERFPNWKTGSNSTFIYGNEVALNEVWDTDGTLKGYSISIPQMIDDPDLDFELGDTYNGLPLLEIEQCAFEFSILKSFTLKHGEIVLDSDSPNESEPTSASDCDHTVNVRSNAFYFLDAQSINLKVDVTFDDDTITSSSYFDYEKGHSVEVFGFSTARSIMLPDNITIIPNAAFSNCGNLCEIITPKANNGANRLSPCITTVCSNAFEGCQSLTYLFIPGNVKNMGNSVFNSWGDFDEKQTVDFENMYFAPVGRDGYNWDANWAGETFDNFTVKFRTSNVIFDKNGGSGGTDSVEELSYGQPMPPAQKPEKTGYKFWGYFTQPEGKGTKYYNDDMTSADIWKMEQDEVMLYAYWTKIEYELIFMFKGNKLHTETIHYGDGMPAIEQFLPAGTVIRGVYDANSTSGKMYYDGDMNAIVENYDIADHLTLYVIRMETKTNYELNGGENSGSNPETVYYADRVLLSSPTKNDFDFLGWYEGEKKVTAIYLRTEEEITLTARWEYLQNVGISTTYVNVCKYEYVAMSTLRLRQSCTITVSPEVKQLTISDIANLSPESAYRHVNIIISKRSTDFTLILNNVSLTSFSGNSTVAQPIISMYTDNNSALLLYARGIVNIKGSVSTGTGDGGCAIYCSTLRIMEASNLTIRGGNGKAVTPVGVKPQFYEGKGGYAVIAENDVIISSKAYVYAYCGEGDRGTPTSPYYIKSGRDVVTV